MMTKVYLYANMVLFSYGFPNHPLSNERYKIFLSKLKSSEILKNKDFNLVKDYPCNEDLLKYFHTDEYIKYVKAKSEEGRGYLDYGDTPAFPGVFNIALESVCATVDAGVKALENKAYSINLAGGWHHARRDKASGFCIFNDIGVLINYLFRESSIERVYYIDIDAHHGDGVYYSFEEDPRVYIFDIHESGYYIYPGTGFEYENGKSIAKGTKRNREVPPRGGDDYLLNYINEAVKWGYEISPDLLILQGGMDGLEGDPLTHLRYTEDGYLEAVNEIFKLRRELNIGLIYLGGGGYQKEVQASLWLKVMSIMLKM